MTRRLLLTYLSIALFVLLILEIPLGITFARSELERLTTAVERDAQVIGSLVEDQLHSGAAAVDPQLGTYAERTGGRVLIVDRDGRTVHDSNAPDDPDALARDYSTRPELELALDGQRNTGVRPSETLGHDLLYVAVPVASGGVVHGAVRITYPTAALDARVQRNWMMLAAIALVVLTATGLVGAAIARWVVRPTRAVEAGVRRLADGDLDVRVPDATGPPELRQLAHGFNAMAERLSRLIRTQQSFVSDASHQLRSPLTALRLELEELEDLPAAAVRERRDGIERAIGETRRLSRLVTDLLELARADAETPEPAIEDVAAVLRDRADAWEAVAAEHGVRLQVEAPPSLHVRAVAGHLAQIVDNLVDNAVEASSPGQVVRLWTDTAGDRTEVHVTDAGPGLSEVARERAFDRFWRGPDARPDTGTGLGLAIARQLAHLSGGEVTLRQAPGGGADAVVTLVAEDAGSTPRQRPAAQTLSGR